MKFILTIALAFIVSASMAQTKHIAPKNTIVLTDKEVIAISTHIDSVQQALSNTSTLPSVQVAGMNQRLNLALYAMWKQIQAQMVADSVKKAGK